MGELGSVGDFVKSAEVTKFTAASEYSDEQGIGGNSEQFLDYESADKTFRVIYAPSAEALLKADFEGQRHDS